MFFVLFSTVLAQKTDVVIMDNNNNITGEIKKMHFGLLTFDTDNLGTLNIKWDKIKHVISKYIFELDLENGGKLIGSLDSSSVSGQVIIKTEKDTFNIYKDNIVEIARIKSSFWEKISGSIALGTNYAKSTGTGQFNFAGSGTFRSKEWSTNSSLNSIFSFQNKKETAKNQNLSINVQRLLPEKWLLGAILSFEQNTELGIQLRTSIIPQGGYIFLQTNTNALWIESGLSFNNEIFTDSTASTYNLDGFAQLKYQIFIYDHPQTTLTTYVNAYPGLTDWGRIRFNYNIIFDWELFSNFYWDLSFYFNYDNMPTGDAATNDYGINSAIKFSFNQ